MLSYCWHPTAKPELVKLLGKELKRQEYDIWRDEEGSSLLPGIEGSIDHRLAEAVEQSAIKLLCISAAYKNSANYRMEASYANRLTKRGKMRLIFLMMNEDYTTVSAPRYCDGWLGILIGDQLWYPAWDEITLQRSIQELLPQCPEQTRLSYGERETVKRSQTALRADLPTLCTQEEKELSERLQRELSSLSGRNDSSRSSNSVSVDPLSKQSTQSGSTDHALASLQATWKILQTSEKIEDEVGLRSYLGEIGITDLQELG